MGRRQVCVNRKERACTQVRLKRYVNSTNPLRRCGEVSREGDTIYSVIARGDCACPVLHGGLREPISMTWCHCSKGSLLSVYR